MFHSTQPLSLQLVNGDILSYAPPSLLLELPAGRGVVAVVEQSKRVQTQSSDRVSRIVSLVHLRRCCGPLCVAYIHVVSAGKAVSLVRHVGCRSSSTPFPVPFAQSSSNDGGLHPKSNLVLLFLDDLAARKPPSHSARQPRTSSTLRIAHLQLCSLPHISSLSSRRREHRRVLLSRVALCCSRRRLRLSGRRGAVTAAVGAVLTLSLVSRGGRRTVGLDGHGGHVADGGRGARRRAGRRRGQRRVRRRRLALHPQWWRRRRRRRRRRPSRPAGRSGGRRCASTTCRRSASPSASSRWSRPSGPGRRSWSGGPRSRSRSEGRRSRPSGGHRQESGGRRRRSGGGRGRLDHDPGRRRRRHRR